MTFAANLKRLRLAAHLTQADLAERADMSVTQIQRYENGAQQKPREITLSRLATALDCTVDNLDEGEGCISKVVGVKMDTGEVIWHAPGVVSDYDTMCGLDANDSEADTYGTVVPKRGQKITCESCKSIWERTVALRLRVADFDVAGS